MHVIHTVYVEEGFQIMAHVRHLSRCLVSIAKFSPVYDRTVGGNREGIIYLHFRPLIFSVVENSIYGKNMDLLELCSELVSGVPLKSGIQ